MVEYLYDIIKASSGEDICICAQITDDDGADITQGCSLYLHNDNTDTITNYVEVDAEGNITELQEPEIATEADYTQALAELGVE